MSKNDILKNKAISLRKKGNTYLEINAVLKRDIPKSTLSFWFRNLELSNSSKKILEEKIEIKNKKSRKKAWKAIREKREAYLSSVKKNVLDISNLLQNIKVSKLALATLYLGEGSKTKKGALMFGNSNPEIIKLFLFLLRCCYEINENSFRCTVQCRADQNVKKLENFWFKVTKIPRNRFYKAQIDPRTIGKITKNVDYKGVCRIDYFSADVFNELCAISEVIFEGL